MAKETPKAAALALYMAATTPDEFTQAAHALAAALDKAPKLTAPIEPDLNSPLKAIKRGCVVVGVIAEWADGSSTYQNVAYSAPGDRYAAAFQSCDRLRRQRASRHLARLADAHGDRVTINGPLQVQYPAPEWLACVKAFPMPALASLTFEDSGETYTPRATYGAGDGVACGASYQAMRDRVAAERIALEAFYAERAAEHAAMIANTQADADAERMAA